MFHHEFLKAGQIRIFQILLREVGYENTEEEILSDLNFCTVLAFFFLFHHNLFQGVENKDIYTRRDLNFRQLLCVIF